MFTRTTLQPEPMKDYILFDKDHYAYLGRWLVGNTYEGWYIKEYLNPEHRDKELPAIFSQKELEVQLFAPVEEFDVSNPKARNYIPKALLDEAFYGHTEVEDFRCTPDILCYL